MSSKPKKSEAGASSSESDDAWVFDSLVNFLRGPVWNVPILTFIEHKSLIFEPDTAGEDNEDEYKKVHDEYKNLVDFMLGSYMEDIGITSSQFEAACGQASARIRSQFHQALFEQVWAADDYEIFKRMMIQKNIELQLQALELLQQRYGALPSSLQAGPGKKEKPSSSSSSSSSSSKGKEGKSRQSESEDKVMEAVVKKSLAEHKAAVKAMDQEKKELEEALAKSASEEKARLEHQRDNQQAMLAEHFKTKVSIQDPSVANPPSLPPLPTSAPPPSLTTLSTWPAQEEEEEEMTMVVPSSPVRRRLEEGDEDRTAAEKTKTTDVLGRSVPMAAPPPAAAAAASEAGPVNAEELKRRTEFLKAQRDKLLAMKKEEREKQLFEAEKQQAKSRPKSARAARSAFGKGRSAAAGGGAAAAIDPQTLKVRRALAEKLKNEVVGRH